jgi:hypothetical protein
LINPAETIRPARYLGRRVVDQSPASAFDGSVSADRQDTFRNRLGGDPPPNPNQLAAEPIPLLGIFSGKPMSPMSLPPSVWDLPDNPDASGGDDWFKFLTRMASQHPA